MLAGKVHLECRERTVSARFNHGPFKEQYF
jgi:hypothetical protein